MSESALDYIGYLARIVQGDTEIINQYSHHKANAVQHSKLCGTEVCQNGVTYEDFLEELDERWDPEDERDAASYAAEHRTLYAVAQRLDHVDGYRVIIDQPKVSVAMIGPGFVLKGGLEDMDKMHERMEEVMERMNLKREAHERSVPSEFLTHDELIVALINGVDSLDRAIVGDKDYTVEQYKEGLFTTVDISIEGSEEDVRDKPYQAHAVRANIAMQLRSMGEPVNEPIEPFKPSKGSSKPGKLLTLLGGKAAERWGLYQKFLEEMQEFKDMHAAKAHADANPDFYVTAIRLGDLHNYRVVDNSEMSGIGELLERLVKIASPLGFIDSAGITHRHAPEFLDPLEVLHKRYGRSPLTEFMDSGSFDHLRRGFGMRNPSEGMDALLKNSIHELNMKIASLGAQVGLDLGDTTDDFYENLYEHASNHGIPLTFLEEDEIEELKVGLVTLSRQAKHSYTPDELESWTFVKADLYDETLGDWVNSQGLDVHIELVDRSHDGAVLWKAPIKLFLRWKKYQQFLVALANADDRKALVKERQYEYHMAQQLGDVVGLAVLDIDNIDNPDCGLVESGEVVDCSECPRKEKIGSLVGDESVSDKKSLLAKLKEIHEQGGTSVLDERIKDVIGDMDQDERHSDALRAFLNGGILGAIHNAFKDSVEGPAPGVEYKDLPDDEVVPVLKEMLRCHESGNLPKGLLDDDVAWYKVKVFLTSETRDDEAYHKRFITSLLHKEMASRGVTVPVIDEFLTPEDEDLVGVLMGRMAVSRKTALANKDLPVPGLG